jgi:1,4-alpha-glucan branching enzyme
VTANTELHAEAVQLLVNGTNGAPFDLLGVHHVDEGRISFRVFRPTASAMGIVVEEADGTAQERVEMEKVHNDGLFEVTLPLHDTDGSSFYYVERGYSGETMTFRDPYAFKSSVITDYDMYLLREGRHLFSYQKLGAHPTTIDGVSGVNFVVWAPNAYRVSVTGNFNRWDARVHPMHRHGDSGLWELFIPGLEAGELYRYDLRSHNRDYHGAKSDPYGFYAERRPQNASIVYDISGYLWEDDDWMETRAGKNMLKEPMSIYEVHLGSWQRDENGEWLTYRDLADKLVQYVKDIGYTHIELMPISEHPFDGSWGYQVTGYYAVTSRYGDPKDFMYFVDQCHQNGIGVILDWVPAHFPKDGYALSYFDGTHLYSHEDPRQGEHPDWGTYIFNYGRNEVRNFLISNALFWLKEYHIDGLRVDAVSSMLYLNFSREQGQWIPNMHGSNENLEAISFLKEFNELVHAHAPGAFTVAEESTSWPMVSRPLYVGGLGFTLKWNMGWMHDTLEYISRNPVYRRFDHNKITFSLFYAFSENFVLPLSHDEVVHGKGSLMGKAAGDWWQKFATLRLLFGYMYTHPGKKLLFMGQEFGQWREWSEERALDWFLLDLPTHQGLQRWSRDLNHFYRSQPALFEVDFDHTGFEWVVVNDADNSVYAYVRYSEDRSDMVIAVCNFTPVVREGYRIGVPQGGRYRELLNSDSAHYGGGDLGNGGEISARDERWGSFQHCLELTLPPLAVLILKPETPEA